MVRASSHLTTKSRSRIRRVAAVTSRGGARAIGVGAAQASTRTPFDSRPRQRRTKPSTSRVLQPVRLDNGRRSTLALRPYTSCWTHGDVTGCYDGHAA